MPAKEIVPIMRSPVPVLETVKVWGDDELPIFTLPKL